MTLAETINTFRNGTKFIIVGAVVLIIGRIFLGITDIRPTAKPTPTPTPPAQYGQIPPLSIASLDLDSSTAPIFTLDLITAVLPDKPQYANIYPIALPKLSLLAQEKATNIAKEFDFREEPELTTEYYTWENTDEKLRIHKKSLFTYYSYDYASHPDIFIPGSIFSTESALNIALNILSARGFSGGYNKSKPQYQLLQLQNGALRQATTLRETSAIRVDFPRMPVENYPVYSENPPQDLVYVIFTGNPQNHEKAGKIIEFQYVRWSVLDDEAGLYNLKTSSSAWEELSGSHNYIVQLLAEGGDLTLPYTPMRVREFRAKEVFLAYMNPTNYQEYLQPVWVFRGTATLLNNSPANWQAYVPAVANEWVSSN